MVTTTRAKGHDVVHDISWTPTLCFPRTRTRMLFNEGRTLAGLALILFASSLFSSTGGLGASIDFGRSTALATWIVPSAGLGGVTEPTAGLAFSSLFHSDWI